MTASTIAQPTGKLLCVPGIGAAIAFLVATVAADPGTALKAGVVLAASRPVYPGVNTAPKPVREAGT